MQAHPEAVDPEALPEAHRALFERRQADNEEPRARVELLADTNRRLEHLVEEPRRAIYGKRSEKRPLDDRRLAFEDLEGAVAEAGEAAAAAGAAGTSPGAVPRGATSGICRRAWGGSRKSSNRTARNVPAGAGR